MGQARDGGDRQHGGGDGVDRIDRCGADGVEAGGEPGRRQQADRDQHQQRDKQHGMATPIRLGTRRHGVDRCRAARPSCR